MSRSKFLSVTPARNWAPAVPGPAQTGGTGWNRDEMAKLNPLFYIFITTSCLPGRAPWGQKEKLPCPTPRVKTSNTQRSWRTRSGSLHAPQPLGILQEGDFLAFIQEALVLAMKASGTLPARQDGLLEPLHYPQPIGSCAASPCPWLSMSPMDTHEPPAPFWPARLWGFGLEHGFKFIWYQNGCFKGCHMCPLYA